MKKNAFAIRKWLVLCGFIVCIGSTAASQFPESSYDIYGMDVKTGRIFQISHGPLTGEYNPSWSQDGNFIVHDVTPPFPAEQYLGVTNVKTGETTMLEGGAGGNNPSWSPNGQWIAFDRCPGFAHGCAHRSIYVVPAGGGTPRFVVNGTTPRWSNNSMRLVFEGQSGGESDGSIRTVDLAGGDEKIIVPPGWWMFSPVWSANGNWIFFAGWGQIFKWGVNERGEPRGDIQVVIGTPPGSYAPTLSNNSMRIAFGSGDVLWGIAASGGVATQLTGPVPWGDYDAAYSNNGQYIAFARYTAPLLKPSVAQQIPAPTNLSLQQNYPNPFNPKTTIHYSLPTDAKVSLAVYDMLGQKVAELVDETMSAGDHGVVFDASQLASGVYVYKLQAGGFVQTKKMLLMK